MKPEATVEVKSSVVEGLGVFSARCRGETGVSFFTLPVEFQREYLPLLMPCFVLPMVNNWMN